jgi:hypothetical protein
MKVWLEKSVDWPLREIVRQNPKAFELVSHPANADVILFDEDCPNYIRKSPEFMQWREKCLLVCEADLPTYFLPACYSSNSNTWLGRGRSRTIPYLFTQRKHPNPFIQPPDWNNPRTYLYSFLGGSTSWPRKKIFKSASNLPDVLIESTDHYNHWNGNHDYAVQKLTHQRRYANALQQSWFFLCPRGAGVSSIRLFEVMQAGVVPVIIADNWVPIPGIDWDKFALFLPEKSLGDLDAKVRDHAPRAMEYARLARQTWEDHLAQDTGAILLHRLIIELQQTHSRSREQYFHWMFPVLEFIQQTKLGSRRMARSLVLKFFALAGYKFPYQLNRPAP